MAKYRLSRGCGLMLRTCDEGMMAYGGFRWPESGEVVAPDWSPRPICGYGLHGLLWGQGDSDRLDWSPSAKWLVCQVRLADVVDLDDKVKAPSAQVVFCGERQGALDFLRPYLKPGMVLHGEVFTGGADCVFTGGDRSTLTGGWDSTLTGGDYSTLTGGAYSTLTGGAYSTLTAGDGSTLTGGRYSTLTAGDGSTLTGGRYSTLTGGNRSILCFHYWDHAARIRFAVAHVGEDGIEPGVAYRCDDQGQIVKA